MLKTSFNMGFSKECMASKIPHQWLADSRDHTLKVSLVCTQCLPSLSPSVFHHYLLTHDSKNCFKELLRNFKVKK